VQEIVNGFKDYQLTVDHGGKLQTTLDKAFEGVLSDAWVKQTEQPTQLKQLSISLIAEYRKQLSKYLTEARRIFLNEIRGRATAEV
jgi:hypothetical protein